MVPVWFAAGMLARVWARDLQPVCYGLSFFTLINVCVDAERTRALSSRRLVVWLSNVGIFSYSLYLVHYPTIMILRELFGFIALPANAWVALAGSAVKFVVSFYVAKLFFLLVERRFLNSAAEFRTVEPAHLTSPGRREYSREP
jgi:peptidoglycan/LPS O-acetylase OafA/YrhL